MLGTKLIPIYGGSVSSDEIGLPVTQTGMTLPCGSTAIFKAD
jgi:23S rRNA (cytosine1962-C5)-methyltransferase